MQTELKRQVVWLEEGAATKIAAILERLAVRKVFLVADEPAVRQRHLAARQHVVQHTVRVTHSRHDGVDGGHAVLPLRDRDHAVLLIVERDARQAGSGTLTPG